MAHELDVIINEQGEQEGHAMFSVVQTPWHRLGTVLTEAPTLDEAMRIGGLDWEVEKRPNFIEVTRQEPCPNPLCKDGQIPQRGWFLGQHAPTCSYCDGAGHIIRTEMKQAERGHSIVRLDRHEVIGVVGDQYHPLQNRKAFEVLEPLLDQGVAHIETGGSLRDGRDVWMLFSLDREKMLEAAGDDALARLLVEVQPFALITNNHAGTRMVVVKETPVRVVCANTLEASLSKRDVGCTVKIEHSKNVVKNVEAAAELLFGNIAARFKKFGSVRQTLVETELPEPVFNRLCLDPVVPIEHLFRKIQRKEAGGHTIAAHRLASEKRGIIRQLWEHGDGHTGDHSAWEAYNGVAQALDHDTHFVSGRDEAARGLNRIQSMFDGNIKNSKVRVLRGLAQYATADDFGRGEMAASFEIDS